MSMRDWLIVTGLVILLGVVADLVRRYLQRGKLKLAIDKKFAGLPDVDVSSELPNGGARIVDPACYDAAESAVQGASNSTSQRSSSQRSIKQTSTPSSETAEPRRVIIDDALMTSPGGLGDVGDHSAKVVGWDIDPALHGGNDHDEEVDLLLEREFKGVGQGADEWLGQSRVVSAPLPVDDVKHQSAADLEPESEPQPEPQSEPQDVASKPAAAVAEPVEQSLAESESALELEATTEAFADSAHSESEPRSAAVTLVEDDLLDLERPVHELLVRQQSVRSVEVESNQEVAVEPETVIDAAVVDQAPAQPKRQTKPEAKKKAKTAAKRSEPRPEEQPSFFDLHPDLAPEIEPVVEKPRSRRRRKKTKPADPTVHNEQLETPVDQQVLIINVQAKAQSFPGPVLFKLVSACGLAFGSKMSIFHRYEDDNGQGALQFSMANAIAPGTFDPDTAESFSTPAITFFLQLSDPTDRMNAFECMLATAQCVADNLNGELRDENRSSMRTQTIEHYRQKVRDFERKQLTRRD